LTAAFPRQARLLKPGEFEAVFAAGRRIQEKWLTAAFRPNALPHARLGLAISARAVPHAVQRNRIKRQVRESFRRRLGDLPALDLVVLARPGAAKAGTPLLRAEIDRIWGRLPTSSQSDNK
jgi:ribonuclease P protein component